MQMREIMEGRKSGKLSFRRWVEYNEAKRANPKPRFYERGHADGLAGKSEAITTRMDNAAVTSYRLGHRDGMTDRNNRRESDRDFVEHGEMTPEAFAAKWETR